MTKRLAEIKNGEKVIYRGVTCMRCNRRDSKLHNKTPNSLFSGVVLVNLKNGSLYVEDKETNVQPVPEKGIAEAA